ncbi:MAG: glycosyl hydrolase [Flavobacteriales bacterium]|nr:glycosyl hydrolase [Flavobacteriales bacterium]NCQ14928.1 glycosyl hydrolase [Flavobacteriales bacterium]NCQ58297.1 glycosyl hydrolase [Flavobacteriales bacterium]NCT14466.1 glycosyl hydrolase [Flavobacteriales bacterium]PIV93803.1 MAG: glycosyl hydrolase [Flavobacteriaceae bacterium CG17_big_fil_post_rev_8_21_14_2_50_33_15]
MKTKANYFKCTIFLTLISLTGCSLKNKEEIKEDTKETPKFELSQMTSEVYKTAHDSLLKLAYSGTVKFGPFEQPKETDASIQVDPSKTFQTFLGIGAALTDASAETFYKLSKDNQDRFLEAYYSKEKGIGYSLGRTIIHSCDFSSGSYTYIEEGDKDLSTFNINHDKTYRLPFTKKAIDAAGGSLTMYASPWSPPAFMKTNNNMLQGGKLKPEFYQSWANYYAKFIKAYEKEGVPIWGLTIQNEPMAVQRWESCIYSAEEERDFLKNFLGPTLEKEGLGDKNIIVWDHNRDLLFQRANVILNDPEAAKYVWGTGFHWYEDWKDGKPMFDAVKSVHENYPDKNLIFTEGCNEKFDWERINNEDPKLAERYGKSMINDFNNGTVAWTDWNILLDETGGPNHVGNLCFSPVHGNTQTGKLTFTNSYYYIGHFSKFIRPGAKRITSVSSANSLLSTAFVNTDGSIVIVIMNQDDKALEFTLNMNSKTAHLNALPHSIQTITLKKA